MLYFLVCCVYLVSTRRGGNNIDAEVNIMGTELEEKVMSSLVDSKLPCAVAFNDVVRYWLNHAVLRNEKDPKGVEESVQNFIRNLRNDGADSR